MEIGAKTDTGTSLDTIWNDYGVSPPPPPRGDASVSFWIGAHLRYQWWWWVVYLTFYHHCFFLPSVHLASIYCLVQKHRRDTLPCLAACRCAKAKSKIFYVISLSFLGLIIGSGIIQGRRRIKSLDT
ncbi:hypothetical protein BKA61DRAFT_270947 [Leptodontidium sp. MPI-SDFR-AT-0119]|nr:hypothetical protein BKA61DRAFT_270947 [Leptodontidium sp. MPI-SDFR-AT-0119]